MNFDTYHPKIGEPRLDPPMDEHDPLCPMHEDFQPEPVSDDEMPLDPKCRCSELEAEYKANELERLYDFYHDR